MKKYKLWHISRAFASEIEYIFHYIMIIYYVKVIQIYFTRVDLLQSKCTINRLVKGFWLGRSNGEAYSTPSDAQLELRMRRNKLGSGSCKRVALEC